MGGAQEVFAEIADANDRGGRSGSMEVRGSRPVVLVIGAGPGVSGFVAKRFANDGFDVILVGLSESALTDLVAAIDPLPVTARFAALDVTDSSALSTAITQLGATSGRIDVLHFNPSIYRPADPMRLTAEQLSEDVGLGVGALLTALQAARPFMSAGSRITATGSMAADIPNPESPSLGVQKAGLRNLVQSIDASLRAEGIRAVSVTVRGALSTEGVLSPAEVANAIVAAARQPEAAWQSERHHPIRGE